MFHPCANFRVLVLSIGSLVVSGCSTGPELDPQWAERPVETLESTAFPDHGGLLSGFDAPLPASEMGRGDRVLYGLRLEKNGETRRWFVAVEARDPRHKRYHTREGQEHFTLLADVRVYDSAGVEMGHDSVLISRTQLVRGLVRACRGDPDEIQDAATPTDGAFRRFIPTEAMQANFSLRSMLRIIRESEVLQDIFWEVIDKPSIFSVIREFGVKVRLDARFADARIVSGPRVWIGATTYEVPVQLNVNDSPALRCRFFVAEPRSPLNLCAGVVAVTAWHPREPDTRLQMRLLAARRGDRSVPGPR